MHTNSLQKTKASTFSKYSLKGEAGSEWSRAEESVQETCYEVRNNTCNNTSKLSIKKVYRKNDYYLFNIEESKQQTCYEARTIVAFHKIFKWQFSSWKLNIEEMTQGTWTFEM